MKFRRKQTDAPVASIEAADPTTGAEAGVEAGVEAGDLQRPAQPRDVSAVDLEGDDIPHVDLGGLVLTQVEGLEVRMQVDEASGAVQAVLYAGPDGAVEVRAFAASRNADMWEEVRPKIAADAARQGGTASEVDGPWGTELVCRVTGTAPDGSTQLQESRVIGFNGPRWFVRATLVGAPVFDDAARPAYDKALGSLLVRRGSGPMSPGEPLPMVVPASARRLDA